MCIAGPGLFVAQTFDVRLTERYKQMFIVMTISQMQVKGSVWPKERMALIRQYKEEYDRCICVQCVYHAIRIKCTNQIYFIIVSSHSAMERLSLIRRKVLEAYLRVRF